MYFIEFKHSYLVLQNLFANNFAQLIKYFVLETEPFEGMEVFQSAQICE